MNFQQTEMATPEHVVVKYRLAGLGSRSFAHILDLLIITVPLVLLFVFTLMTLDTAFGQFIINLFNEYVGYFLAGILIIVFILSWGYFALFEYFTGGQTPGKMLVGLRVIQDGGQSITFLSAMIRNFMRIVDMLPSFYLVGIFMLFLHPSHKRIGDLVAGTLVVYEGSRSKKKKTPLEKEMEKRGMTPLDLDPWVKSRLTMKEWKLLSAYMERRDGISQADREAMVFQISKILFSKVDVPFHGKSISEMENVMFALYLTMKEEWEYRA